MPSLDQQLLELKEDPRNWDLRLEVIERLAAKGNLEEARKLVRDSPDGPVPYPVQKRLWSALSGESDVRVISKEDSGVKPNLVAKAKVLNPDEESVPPKPVPYQPKAKLDSEKEAPQVVEPKPHQISKPDAAEKEPLKIGLNKSKGDPEAAAGIKLEPLDKATLPIRKSPPTTGSKMSALTTAIVAHLGLILLFTFVAIHVPVARAPKITVLPAPPGEKEEVMRKTIVQKTELSTPAAPSMAAAAVITVAAASPVKAPQVQQDSQQLDVNVLDTAVGMSMGFSFEGEGRESAVSFFGIEGGGRRIAFLVDANPEMLLDEKGGMFAYDKVKAEIAAMLSALNRGTAFNIIVFQGKRLSMFRSEPVRALPSNIHRAKQWLDPLNRTYEALGLREDFTEEGIRPGAEPIDHRDIAYYSKAIQAALEQDVNAVFCISNGWGGMGRSLSAEDQAKLDEARAKHREEVAKLDIEVTYNPAEVAAWKKAQDKARDWLNKENEARRQKGLAPKVVLNFGELVTQITPGARPPRGVRSQEPPPGPSLADLGIERMPGYTPEDVQSHIENVVTANYGKNKPDRPKIHMVLFLGEREDIGEYEEHFVQLTRRNQGQLKILRGLAALDNVTGFK
tara:strand:- start:7830 stop:9695 length:1866 start_codon:yes stop_codon:yes gene_type:complete